MQSQSWGEWLDEKLWDAERKAKNAWWRARTEWYCGTDRLADLFRREGPGRHPDAARVPDWGAAQLRAVSPRRA